MSKYLIVVDMQNDFVSGALGTPEAREIVPLVREKIEKRRNEGYNIIFTRDTHFENYLDTAEGKHLPVEHCIANTPGWYIIDELGDIDDIEIIDKSTFGWLYWTFQREDEIELVGLCTDICVVSNALILKAMFPNNKISVDSKCCAGATVESHEAALLIMKMCHIEII